MSVPAPSFGAPSAVRQERSAARMGNSAAAALRQRLRLSACCSPAPRHASICLPPAHCTGRGDSEETVQRQHRSQSVVVASECAPHMPMPCRNMAANERTTHHGVTRRHHRTPPSSERETMDRLHPGTGTRTRRPGPVRHTAAAPLPRTDRGLHRTLRVACTISCNAICCFPRHFALRGLTAGEGRHGGGGQWSLYGYARGPGTGRIECLCHPGLWFWLVVSEPREGMHTPFPAKEAYTHQLKMAASFSRVTPDARRDWESPVCFLARRAEVSRRQRGGVLGRVRPDVAAQMSRLDGMEWRCCYLYPGPRGCDNATTPQPAASTRLRCRHTLRSGTPRR